MEDWSPEKPLARPRPRGTITVSQTPGILHQTAVPDPRHGRNQASLASHSPVLLHQLGALAHLIPSCLFILPRLPQAGEKKLSHALFLPQAPRHGECSATTFAGQSPARYHCSGNVCGAELINGQVSSRPDPERLPIGCPPPEGDDWPWLQSMPQSLRAPATDLSSC